MPDWECSPCGTQMKNKKDRPNCYACSNPMTIVAAPMAAPAAFTALKWTNHKNKHAYPKGASVTSKGGEKGIIASTEKGPAVYAANVNVRTIETRCLAALNNVSGIVETGQAIGWCKGEECTKIQIYAGGDGSFHGQPVSDDLADGRGGINASL